MMILHNIPSNYMEYDALHLYPILMLQVHMQHHLLSFFILTLSFALFKIDLEFK